METIKLKVSKKFYGRLLSIIEKCDPGDLQIVNEDYHSAKVYLEKQLNDLDSETSQFLTLEELDELLENVLSKSAG